MFLYHVMSLQQSNVSIDRTLCVSSLMSLMLPVAAWISTGQLYAAVNSENSEQQYSVCLKDRCLEILNHLSPNTSVPCLTIHFPQDVCEIKAGFFFTHSSHSTINMLYQLPQTHHDTQLYPVCLINRVSPSSSVFSRASNAGLG